MTCNCNNNCTCTSVKVCEQTNIPQVDNTALECANCGFVNLNCVVSPDAFPYLSLAEDSTLKEIITALVASLSDARNRITTLENN